MGPSSQQWPMVNHWWEGVVNQLKPFDHLDTIDGMFVFEEADDIHGTTQTTKICADVFSCFVSRGCVVSLGINHNIIYAYDNIYLNLYILQKKQDATYTCCKTCFFCASIQLHNQVYQESQATCVVCTVYNKSFLHQKHQVVSASFWPECAHCILFFL